MENLTNKKILFIICGGISAYKSLEVIRLFKKDNAVIKTILTKNAKEFVTPLSVASLSSGKVYDDFFKKNTQTANNKLCEVRKTFDQFNLISGLHSFFSKEDRIYENILPPLRLLNKSEEKELFEKLKSLNFELNSEMAA